MRGLWNDSVIALHVLYTMLRTREKRLVVQSLYLSLVLEMFATLFRLPNLAFPRLMVLPIPSSLFQARPLTRSGALVSAGVMDSGYKGAVGTLLQVVHSQGLLQWRDPRWAQMVLYQTRQPVQGYSDAYQGWTSV